VEVDECPIRQAAVVDAELPNSSTSEKSQGQGGFSGGEGEDPLSPAFQSPQESRPL